VEHIGIDVHKKESQICITTEEGEIQEKRIPTRAVEFEKMFGKRERARILIESSTESEWVARCLEGLGHEVVVADPNFAPMYATRSKKVKTDRRDALALADACRLGAYRASHRMSDEQWEIRARLTVRDSLVKTRSKYISLARALLRRHGRAIPSGQAETFATRVKSLELPQGETCKLSPLLSLMTPLNEQIEILDQEIEKIGVTDRQVRRLQTVPCIGPIISAAFVAGIDHRPERFATSHKVGAYLGLVPTEHSSGEGQMRGRITKAGWSMLRSLLVQAAWLILRSKDPSTEALRQWATRIAHRRGKRIAAVAMARRLSGILFAMLRDETDYQPAILPTTVSKAA
jgi:transposase